MNSKQRSFFRKELNKRSGMQVCIVCEKPIQGRVIWRAVGKIIRVKRPHHEGCK